MLNKKYYEALTRGEELLAKLKLDVVALFNRKTTLETYRDQHIAAKGWIVPFPQAKELAELHETLGKDVNLQALCSLKRLSSGSCGSEIITGLAGVWGTATDKEAILAYAMKYLSFKYYNFYQCKYVSTYADVLKCLHRFGADILAAYPNPIYNGAVCYLVGWPGKDLQGKHPAQLESVTQHLLPFRLRGPEATEA